MKIHQTLHLNTLIILARAQPWANTIRIQVHQSQLLLHPKWELTVSSLMRWFQEDYHNLTNLLLLPYKHQAGQIQFLPLHLLKFHPIILGTHPPCLSIDHPFLQVFHFQQVHPACLSISLQTHLFHPFMLPAHCFLDWDQTPPLGDLLLPPWRTSCIRLRRWRIHWEQPIRPGYDPSVHRLFQIQLLAEKAFPTSDD